MFSKRTEWKLTPNLLTKAQEELRAAGTPVLDLTVSNPTRAGLTLDSDSILAALSQAEALDYDPQARGLLSARQAVARYYHEQHELFDVNPESIILTTSTSEAYSHVFRLLCNAGDEILVPKPSYPLFDFLAELHDVTLVPYPLLYDHGWQIDFPSLYKAVNHRTRGVVVVHPNNPTGSYASPGEISSLNRFCQEYNLALLVDEVFLDYPLDGASRQSFAANQEALTFTLSGLSKISGLPQMKLSWMMTSGPAEKVQASLSRLEIIADTYLSVSTPIQLAAAAMLEHRRQVQPLLIDRLRSNLEEMDRQLQRQNTCQKLNLDGGWYVLLRVPVTSSDEELAVRLLRDAQVLTHPGHFYDFAADGYLVLSLITPAADFREGLARVLKLLES